jgi:hypothetical protein
MLMEKTEPCQPSVQPANKLQHSAQHFVNYDILIAFKNYLCITFEKNKQHMKTTFLSLAFALFGLGALNAQQADQNWNPSISFDKETYDYGTIKNGADGTCEFTFKNTGKEPLLISNARGSCGCTVPEWPKEPIGPGQSSAIKVSYDTKRTGAINKNITLTIQNVGKDKTSSKMLYIKGNVEPPPADAGAPEKKSGLAPLEK